MAVYTPVSEAELQAFLSLYDIGTLVRFEGIEQGVSNTNYHLFTDKDRYILTLFEPHRVEESDIPFYVDYAVCLSEQGVPCPRTLKQKNGAVLGRLHDRPAAIYSFLEGDGGTAAMLNADLCGKAGNVLAQMHVAAGQISATAENHFGLKRWKEWLAHMGPSMNTIEDGLYETAKTELAWIERHFPQSLPAGAIHADFFPDNVFFKAGNITGVIDFHFVCQDLFAYDLAIAINAWCFDPSNNFDQARMQSMLRGYAAARPLSQAEQNALPVLLRAGAMRFLLSRAEEKLAWTPDRLMKPHDPLVFAKRLKHFQRMAEWA